VTATGARTWRTKPNAETNGKRENARNVGQLGTCRSGCAVNKLRGKRCREKNWLRETDAFPEPSWRISEVALGAPSGAGLETANQQC